MLCENFDNIRWGSPEAERFAKYWRSLAPAPFIPRRSSFDPIWIAPLLPGITMYEIISPDEIVCRLAGTALVDHFGLEMTGRNFLDFWPGEHRRKVADVLMECVRRPCGVLSKIVTRSAGGKIETNTSVGFPLLDERDVCCRMVFYSNDFQRQHIRIPREDRIHSLDAPKNILIDLSAAA